MKREAAKDGFYRVWQEQAIRLSIWRNSLATKGRTARGEPTLAKNVRDPAEYCIPRHESGKAGGFIEAESRKIGNIHLPDAVLESLCAGAGINIDVSFEARVDFLLQDYSYFLSNPPWLNTRLAALSNLQSRETIQRCQDFSTAYQWRPLITELLELHYDPLYHRSQWRNFTQIGTPEKFICDDLSEAGIATLAQRIASRETSVFLHTQH